MSLPPEHRGGAVGAGGRPTWRGTKASGPLPAPPASHVSAPSCKASSYRDLPSTGLVLCQALYLHWLLAQPQQACEAGDTTVPVLQGRDWRLREGRPLAHARAGPRKGRAHAGLNHSWPSIESCRLSLDNAPLAPTGGFHTWAGTGPVASKHPQGVAGKNYKSYKMTQPPGAPGNGLSAPHWLLACVTLGSKEGGTLRGGGFGLPWIFPQG